MLLVYCSKCEHHEKVELNHKSHSRCLKENCLSIYSNCLTQAAVKKFIADNNFDDRKMRDSALEMCYPLL